MKLREIFDFLFPEKLIFLLLNYKYNNMEYQFNITTTESRIITKSIKLDQSMSIEDLKVKLVGPIMKTIGTDKIKFFQAGKHFVDSQTVGDFIQEEKILIFPMVPSLRTILISNFNSDKKEESETSDDEDKTEDESEKIDEEKPHLELKSNSDILEEINDTLELFSDSDMLKLLNIYFQKKDIFLEFLNYLSSGEYSPSEINEDLDIPDEILIKIKETFKFFEEYTLDELRDEIKKYNGNLNILISSKMLL